LDNLTDENFESNFVQINKLVKQIDKTKTYLRENFSEENVKSKSDAVHTSIKQIRAKFDSIIEEKKKAQIEISAELIKTVNQKKLINYQR
jgi:uncharacterized membrane protein